MSSSPSTGTDPGSGTTRMRGQSWRGLKAPVKKALSLPGVHTLVRVTAPHWPRPVDMSRLPAPRTVRQVTAEMAGVTFTMLRPDRCVLAKELYWGGGRRPRSHDQLALDVFARLVGDVDVVLDIGSYTGIFSLLSARVNPSATVHAFEVVPAVHAAAWANVVANDVVRRVTVHLCGVGRDDSFTTMPSGAGGSALPDFLSTEMEFTRGVEVPISSLDAIWAQVSAGSAPGSALLKIDVEGRELDVLRNGMRFLETHRPDMLCEVLPDADGDELATLLRPLGYTFYRLESHALRQCPQITGLSHWRDWLFSRRSPKELEALQVPVSD